MMVIIGGGGGGRGPEKGRPAEIVRKMQQEAEDLCMYGLRGKKIIIK